MAVNYQSIKCSSCGANLSGPGTCPYCGTVITANNDSVQSAPSQPMPQININVNNIPFQGAPYQDSYRGAHQSASYQGANAPIDINVNSIPYQGTPYQASNAPVGQLKTNKGLIKTILLSLITFGIYAIVVMSSVSSDINIVASRYDGKKTMHFCLLLFVIAPITLGIGAIVWFHKLSDRIGGELRRRGIAYSFGAKDFWLWGVLGSFIYIGPFIYFYRLFKATNSICAHYNTYG